MCLSFWVGAAARATVGLANLIIGIRTADTIHNNKLSSSRQLQCRERRMYYNNILLPILLYYCYTFNVCTVYERVIVDNTTGNTRVLDLTMVKLQKYSLQQYRYLQVVLVCTRLCAQYNIIRHRYTKLYIEKKINACREYNNYYAFIVLYT